MENIILIGGPNNGEEHCLAYPLDVFKTTEKLETNIIPYEGTLLTNKTIKTFVYKRGNSRVLLYRRVVYIFYSTKLNELHKIRLIGGNIGNNSNIISVDKLEQFYFYNGSYYIVTDRLDGEGFRIYTFVNNS